MLSTFAHLEPTLQFKELCTNPMYSSRAPLILKALIETAIDGIVVLDSSNKIISCNAAMERLTGWRVSELVDEPMDMLIPNRFQENHRAGLARYIDVQDPHILGNPYIRLPILHKCGYEIPTHISIAHFQDEGKDYFTGIIRDVTDLVEYEENQQTLMNELNHRVKNTMAIILSIIGQTAQNSRSIAEFRDVLHDRVLAMGQMHDLLVEHNWDDVLILEILERVLNHYGRPWDYSGPSLEVKPSAAVNLSMVFHELATNCIKHGAWSDGGEVCIEVHMQDGVACVVWREINGPPVEIPTRTGFGSKLLKRGIGGAPGSKVELFYEPAGLRAVITLPLSHQILLK